MMKKLYILLIGLVVFACNKEEFDPQDPDVDLFVKTMMEGKYDNSEDSYYLPDFDEGNIPELLSYAEDLRTTKSFPINPISSVYAEAPSVGECALWAVEAIRTRDHSKTEYLAFPSLTPELRKDDENEQSYALNQSEFLAAVQAYKDWWNNNQDKDFEEFKDINPLEDLEYYWY